MPEVGTRICDRCRRYFHKQNLVANHRGQFCRSCWEQYRKNGEGI